MRNYRNIGAINTYSSVLGSGKSQGGGGDRLIAVITDSAKLTFTSTFNITNKEGESNGTNKSAN